MGKLKGELRLINAPKAAKINKIPTKYSTFRVLIFEKSVVRSCVSSAELSNAELTIPPSKIRMGNT
jgi:hypothetical protein